MLNQVPEDKRDDIASNLLSARDDRAPDDYPGTGSASPPPVEEPVPLRRSM